MNAPRADECFECLGRIGASRTIVCNSERFGQQSCMMWVLEWRMRWRRLLWSDLLAFTRNLKWRLWLNLLPICWCCSEVDVGFTSIMWWSFCLLHHLHWKIVLLRCFAFVFFFVNLCLQCVSHEVLGLGSLLENYWKPRQNQYKYEEPT